MKLEDHLKNLLEIIYPNRGIGEKHGIRFIIELSENRRAHSILPCAV